MFDKITGADLAGKGVIGLPDTPELSAAEMQQKFEETAREVIVPKFNALIDALGQADAAGQIGAQTIDGLDGTTVQLLLQALKEKIDDINLDIVEQKVPDGSITTPKFAANAKAPFAGQSDSSVYARNGIQPLSYTKSGTVHQLTGLAGITGAASCIFMAAAAFNAGDTFTVDGTAYTVQLSNGEEAEDNLFVSGAAVPVIVDTGAKKVNFKAGGRKGNEYAPLTVPLEFRNLQNLLYDIPEVAANNFYIPIVPKENEDGTIVLQQSYGGVGLVDINKKTVISSISPTDSKFRSRYTAYSEEGDILFLVSAPSSSSSADNGSGLSIRNRATLAEISSENGIFLALFSSSPTGKYLVFYHTSSSTYRVYNYLGNLVYSVQKASEEYSDHVAINDDGVLITIYHQGSSSLNRDLMANIYTNNGATKNTVILREHSTKTVDYDTTYTSYEYYPAHRPMFVDNETAIIPYRQTTDNRNGTTTTNMAGKFNYSNNGTLTHNKSVSISSYSIATENRSTSYTKIMGFDGSYPFLVLDKIVSVSSVNYGTVYYIDVSDMTLKNTKRYDVLASGYDTDGVVCPDGWYFYGGSNSTGIMCYRGGMSS